jgi:hypothetical protein
MQPGNKTLLAILIVGAMVALTVSMFLGYVPGGFETVPPEYLDPSSSNYLRLVLINNGTSNDTMEFMMQFHHQKAVPPQVFTRTYMGVGGVVGYLDMFKVTGQINQTQYDAGWIQLNAILSTPTPEPEPVPIVNETIITPVGGGGGVVQPPPSNNDGDETAISDDESSGGITMAEIAIYIMLGIVSMILAYLATIVTSIYMPQLQNPAGMIVSICGFFALIFYIMALILGMA